MYISYKWIYWFLLKENSSIQQKCKSLVSKLTDLSRAFWMPWTPVRWRHSEPVVPPGQEKSFGWLSSHKLQVAVFPLRVA